MAWNPSPVLTDTLSPPSGERDGARGAFAFNPGIIESLNKLNGHCDH
jgi:hypothetical protein